MAPHDFLRQLGLVVVPKFLSAEECSSWRELADRSTGHKAQIYDTGESRQDDSRRKTREVVIQGADKTRLDHRIDTLRGGLEERFNVSLGDTDAVRCLVYGPGDFFLLHADTVPVEAAAYRHIGMRRVSIVVFLNDPTHQIEPYEGGELTFYGLLSVPGSRGFGFPVDAETGLLVAFPSGTLHEVSAVTRGKRYTLVTWFWERESAQGGADPVAARRPPDGRDGSERITTLGPWPRVRPPRG
jgi:predicted 2-oxoglutarate/Fe(II)-dependent dioxygenase YbiX